MQPGKLFNRGKAAMARNILNALKVIHLPVAALRVCKRCAAPGPMARGGPSKPQNY